MSEGAISGLPMLLDVQAEATGPDSHVWLAASAGTGKTQVLTARVFRLLLRGTDPGAILCLTFTKAGAAEMAGRINQRLAAWVRMPERQLRQDLAALGENWRDAMVMSRARTLFARVLDAPGGGVRIQTIHSFCQSLLAAFPLEADLVPGFRPLETREEATLARDVLAELLVEADVQGRPAIGDALAALSLRMGEEAAEGFLCDCARAPDGMAALPSGILPYLRQQVGLPIEDVDRYLAELCGDAAFDTEPLCALAAANAAWGANTGLAFADTAQIWLAADQETRLTTIDDVVALVRTRDGKMRSPSRKLIEIEPAYEAMAEALAGQCDHIIGRRALAGFVDFLAPVLDAGRAYAALYQRAKRRLGAVDFDDLIRATVRLLARPDMGDWVRYKLDQATDHILVDEAQDTNRAQWTIIEALADEFFAGRGAHGDKARTLFVVGDFKQAIFGFQGTNPLFFAQAERQLGGRALAAFRAADGEGTPFRRLSLTESFRSTAPVLEFVDAMLAALPAPGLGPTVDLEPHASKVGGPGTVTLWPPVIAGAGEIDDAAEEDWVDDATRILARRIAAQVRAWLDPANPLMLASKDRAVRPEDIMILVKRRGDLASLIVARLYAEQVPVAGIDRLRLNTPLAVQDLLAAIRFVLQPDDDLTLASLLVSPLIGWTQERLMNAAVPRDGKSLWRHLRDTQSDADLAPLRAMLDRADLTTPYQFLEAILSGPLDGRRKLLGRLGEEARDPIDELLAAALDFEGQATPTLQYFLAWFDRGEVEIKRDPSQPLDAVRVMTAHGAKGLQAPLVIIADATVDPDQSPRSTLDWSPDSAAPPIPVPFPRKAERVDPFASLAAERAERELEEHWRLFYVAATRAEEQLVIAGALGPKAKGVPPTNSWYAAASAAFDRLGVDAADDSGERIFAGTRVQPAARRPARARPVPAELPPLPDWARAPAPQEARPPRPLAPSAIGTDDAPDPPPVPAMRWAAERGRLIHALFQRLPGVAAADRLALGDGWLAGSRGVADPAARHEMLAAVTGVLYDPRFTDLFGPDALAEAPVSAVLANGVVVAGTVDRLLITPDLIRVIDFKTNRLAPATLDDVPPAHLAQMAAYVAAMEVIFPGRRVEAALLYTAGPRLIVLPDALLGAQKLRLGAIEQSLGDAA